MLKVQHAPTLKELLAAPVKECHRFIGSGAFLLPVAEVIPDFQQDWLFLEGRTSNTQTLLLQGPEAAQLA